MPRPNVRRAVAPLALVGLLAGCGGGGLYEFPTVDGTAEACSALIADLPDVVLDQERTPVDADRVAAWGDPRIVLRCGVTPPEALLPTSPCDDVNGVGWFTEERDDTTLFTTIGRDPDVSVEVPDGLEPPGAALVDVGDAVAAGSRAVDPCV